MNVYVLVTCRGEEHLPLSLLVFDTIRTGFPTATIYVCDNRSDFGSKAIEKKARAVGAEYWLAGHRMEHGDFIRDQLSIAVQPTVFVDTDVIFWESCEDIAIPEGKLYAGRFIPEMIECGARMPARIHPSLLFVPDPVKLHEALEPIHKQFWYFRPFQGYSVADEKGVVCYDTCSSLYSALPDAAYTFGEAELDRYDHLFGATYPDRFKEMGMSPETEALIRRSHADALGPNRTLLRGLWRTQIRPYERTEKPSWHYWSGLLMDGAGRSRFAFMHAEFSAPGIEPFAHTSVTELLAPGRRCAGDQAGLTVRFDPLPKPDSPLPLGTIEESHEADFVTVHDFTLAVDDEVFSGLHGDLWYEHEDREVKMGSGWRWISLRFNDGRMVMLYDRSDAPQRYVELGPDGWRGVAADVFVMEQTTYENKWAVSLPDDVYTVTPIRDGQEIVDENRGVRYLEAFCSLTNGKGELVGTAWVEIVPAQKSAAVVKSKTPQTEMHLRWAQNHKDAAALIGLFGYATQLADDLVDLDRKWVQTPEGRAEVMTEVLLTCLIHIPANPFFHQNRHHYGPLFVSCLGTWEATVGWAKSPTKETRMFAYVLREAAGRLIEMTAFLIGGSRWQRQVVREIHDYYHGPGGVESFESWEAGG